MTFGKIRLRPAIWLGEIALACLAWYALNQGMSEVGTACIVGITALLPKLVESEEKGE